MHKYKCTISSLKIALYINMPLSQNQRKHLAASKAEFVN